MNRFFEKSDNITSLEEPEIHSFLRDNNLIGKVGTERVTDFYNALSRIAGGDEIKETESIDYDYYNCKKQEDYDVIDSLKEEEKEFLSDINPELITENRVLKAAAALAHRFEKMHAGEVCDSEDANTYLKRLFTYEEESQIPDKPATFGDMLSLDLEFMKYIALLSKKPSFLKSKGKVVRDDAGKIIKYSQMENFSEVFHSDLVNMAFPDFNKKLATKDMYVKNRFVHQEKSQNLIMLVDDSGSMNDPQKRAMLQAALTLKLSDTSDAHNLYIGTFEMHIYGFKKIEKDTKFSDIDFIRLTKGNTDVNGCIMKTIECIRNRKLFGFGRQDIPLSEDHFEIMVINDGEDQVNPDYHPQIKIHALCLKAPNINLKNICHRSGGTYNHIKGYEE